MDTGASTGAGTDASTGTGGRPGTGALVDRYGRTATDLRVSLTDRCNLRCTYCMPAEGLDWLPTPEVLTDDEVVRLVTVAVERLGVREVRFTGGEPLVRRGLEGIVGAVAALRTADGTAPETSLTTNGIGLARRAQGLAEAGLGRVNVSVDTLDRAQFAALTRRDRLPDVLEGVAAAVAAGLQPVKVNAVAMRGVNEDQVRPLLRWAVADGLHLRFIEQMPLGPRHAWDRAQMVTAEELLTELGREFALEPVGDVARGAAPAELWTVVGTGGDGRPPATVGVIGAVTRPFCGACDRTRLTADGQVRSCLFSRRETDLRDLLRAGASDEELADAWRTAMWGKPAAHGIDEEGFRQPLRLMSAIGG
ncbi:GTP 3',8-cyclase MoaA [Cellulomonas marina]|uniref:GTP 3',8-cyclase MoaA n=1 Tax=Cellulomonas marina TaxID=988821 RepID=UPI0015873231|nr:GTP 3',8-cyclase MoaA [Cellulomonas marina]